MSLFPSNDLAKQLQGEFDGSSLLPPVPTGVIQDFPVAGEMPWDSQQLINCWDSCSPKTNRRIQFSTNENNSVTMVVTSKNSNTSLTFPFDSELSQVQFIQKQLSTMRQKGFTTKTSFKDTMDIDSDEKEAGEDDVKDDEKTMDIDSGDEKEAGEDDVKDDEKTMDINRGDEKDAGEDDVKNDGKDDEKTMDIDSGDVKDTGKNDGKDDENDDDENDDGQMMEIDNDDKGDNNDKGDNKKNDEKNSKNTIDIGTEESANGRANGHADEKNGGKAMDIDTDKSADGKKAFYKYALLSLILASKERERKKSIKRIMEQIQNISEKNTLEELFKKYGLLLAKRKEQSRKNSSVKPSTGEIKPEEGYTAKLTLINKNAIARANIYNNNSKKTYNIYSPIPRGAVEPVEIGPDGKPIERMVGDYSPESRTARIARYVFFLFFKLREEACDFLSTERK